MITFLIKNKVSFLIIFAVFIAYFTVSIFGQKSHEDFSDKVSGISNSANTPQKEKPVLQEAYSASNDVDPSFYTEAQKVMRASNKKICDALVFSERKVGLTPTGTIDHESLTMEEYTNYARITGTFSHTGGLEVLIWEGDVNLLSPRPLPTKPNPISYDNGDHGGELEYCPRFSDQGRYFSEIRKPLKKGTYTVGVYTYDNIYDNGYQGNTPSLLIASGTLRVLN